MTNPRVGWIRVLAVVVGASLSAWVGAAEADSNRTGLHITPSGYQVPVHGMSLVRDAAGRLSTHCGHLTVAQVAQFEMALATGRSAAVSRQALVQSALGGMTFSIVYTDTPGQGFDDPAAGPARRAAMEATLAAWSAVLEGSVPVVVRVSMEAQGPTKLASAGSVDYVQMNGRMVPFSLAVQLGGAAVNGGRGDIEATFNSEVSWNYALDGASEGAVSFVYTAMHEIGHGLGFADTFDPATGHTSMALPTPFDAYVNRGSPAADLVVGHAADAVRADLVSDDLFFSGPGSMRYSQVSIRPMPMIKLYAPNPYESGSSVSHVDQNTYSDLQVGLMTPNSFPGPGRGSIDDLTASIMADLGYRRLGAAANPGSGSTSHY